MYRSPTKAAVGSRIIQLLGELLAKNGHAISDAKVGGLGGDGAFAQRLLEAGVKQGSLYLVERKGQRSGALMERFPGAFHIHGDVTQLGQHFAAHNQGTEGLDLFDWDLNGTIEPVHDDLLPILPLLARGTARLLTVTLADARRNLCLEASDETLARVSRTFGQRPARVLAQNLLALHSAHQSATNGYAHPANITFRELSALAHLWELFSKCGLTVDQVHRWIYLSGDFRLRTYAFHLRLSDVCAADEFVELVRGSPCEYVSCDQQNPIFSPYPFPSLEVITSTGHKNPNGDQMMNIERAANPVPALEADVQLLRSVTSHHVLQVQDALERVLRSARVGATLPQHVERMLASGMRAFQEVVNQELTALAGSADTSEGQPNEVPLVAQPNERAPKDFVVPTMEGLPQHKREAELAWLKMAEIRLNLIKAYRQNCLDEEIRAIAENQAQPDLTPFRRSMMSILARGLGKFRPEFMAHYVTSPSVIDALQFGARIKRLSVAYDLLPVYIFKLVRGASYWKAHSDPRHEAWIEQTALE